MTADARPGRDGDQPLVSVVLPTRNAAATLGAQLDALIAQEPGVGFEVVVADNGSTDGTAALVESHRGGAVDVRPVAADTRAGAGYARNCGAREARGELLLFCDADDVVDESWIRAMVDALQSAEVVGGSTDVTRLNDPAVASWRGESRQDALPSSVFLPAGISANMGVTASAFAAIGGFNEDLVVGEDIDFFWRIQLAGYSAGFAPNSVVHYRLRHDLRSTARQAFIYGRANAPLYRLHRGHGMRRRPLRLTLRQLGWVVVHSPDWFGGRARRGQWVWGAANLAGRVVGAAESRTFYI
jgi:glycosyltransferase involved in cell wall biosynthesis